MLRGVLNRGCLTKSASSEGAEKQQKALLTHYAASGLRSPALKNNHWYIRTSIVTLTTILLPQTVLTLSAGVLVSDSICSRSDTYIERNACALKLLRKVRFVSGAAQSIFNHQHFQKRITGDWRRLGEKLSLSLFAVLAPR